MFILSFAFFGTRTICRKKQVETAPLENFVPSGLAAGHLRSIIEGRLYMEKTIYSASRRVSFRFCCIMHLCAVGWRNLGSLLDSFRGFMGPFWAFLGPTRGFRMTFEIHHEAF